MEALLFAVNLPLILLLRTVLFGVAFFSIVAFLVMMMRRMMTIQSEG